MNKITIDSSVNYVSASLTFRCNLNCPYCINDYTTGTKSSDAEEELAGEWWITGLNRIETNGIPFTFEGGEPTIHRDFYKIVNGIDNKVNVLTNLTFNVDKFINEVDPRKMRSNSEAAFKSLRVSFHAPTMDMDKTIEKAVRLQEAGFGVGIFAISYPDSTDANIQMAEKCRKNALYFFIKDYLGYYKSALLGHYRYPDALDGSAQQRQCITNELLIGPNGNVYRCHRDMYAGEYQIANILDEKLEINQQFRRCWKYGQCNPCDVKLKSNRFLKSGYSSVEIKP